MANDHLGLSGAFGVAGAQQALRQRVLDQLAAEKQKQDLAIQQQDLILRQRQVAGQEADRAGALAERTQAARDTAAAKAAPSLAGTNLTGEQFQPFKGTTSEGLFTPQIGLPSRQTQGALPLPGGGAIALGSEGHQPSPAPQSLSVPPLITRQAPQRLTGRMIGTGTAEQQKQAREDTAAAAMMNDSTVPAPARLLIRARLAGTAGAIPADILTGGPVDKTLTSTADGLRLRSEVTKDLAAGKTVRPPVNIDNTLVVTSDGLRLRSDVMKGLASGETVQPRATAQTQNRADSARSVASHIPEIRQEMNDVQPFLGPLKGRFTDLIEGKVGAGELLTGSPEAAAKVEKFFDDLALLKSGTAMVHGGQRGAANVEMARRFDKMMSTSMDQGTLTGALDSFESWLKEYATAGRSPSHLPGDQAATAPVSSGVAGLSYQDYVNSRKK